MRKILSLDGGGLFGVLPAALLTALEVDLPDGLAKHFDMIAGTSTGGIIACGLSLGIKASQILSLYSEKGPEIFAARPMVSGCGLWSAKYSSDALDQELRNILGTKALYESPVNLLVTAYCTDLPEPIDTDHDGVPECASPWLFRSWRAIYPVEDFRLVDVALATSAAPTYFPAHNALNMIGDSYTFIDGGVFANNPALLALIEAQKLWPGEEIRVLSIGTGSRIKAFKAGNWGYTQWGPKIASAFMDGSEDTISMMCRNLLGDKFVRCQIAIPANVDDAMDNTNASNMASLRALGNIFSTKFLDQAKQFLS